MAQALADESGRLVTELHGALQEMDPVRWNVAAAGVLRDRVREIHERLDGLTDASWPEAADGLRVKLLSMREALATLPDEESTLGTAKARWMAFRKELVPRYEAVKNALDDLAIHVPSLRPTNYRRSVFHACMATTTVGILYLLPDPVWGIAVVAPFFVWAWTMEILRRTRPRLNAALMNAFGPFAHPYETHRVNSATWYTTGLMILSFTQAPLVCAIGIAVLGFGDPVAALVGRRWGHHKLLHGRTLEGSCGFLAAGLSAGFVAALVFAPDVACTSLLVIAAAGAVAGTCAELLSLRVDDNLSVALTAAAGASGAALLLGVPV